MIADTIHSLHCCNAIIHSSSFLRTRTEGKAESSRDVRQPFVHHTHQPISSTRVNRIERPHCTDLLELRSIISAAQVRGRPAGAVDCGYRRGDGARRCRRGDLSQPHLEIRVKTDRVRVDKLQHPLPIGTLTLCSRSYAAPALGRRWRLAQRHIVTVCGIVC